MDILECGTMTWLSSLGAVQGTAPPPREGSAWAFDPKTAKVGAFSHADVLYWFGSIIALSWQ